MSTLDGGMSSESHSKFASTNQVDEELLVNPANADTKLTGHWAHNIKALDKMKLVM
jgi:hypothetical protein